MLDSGYSTGHRKGLASMGVCLLAGANAEYYSFQSHRSSSESSRSLKPSFKLSAVLVAHLRSSNNVLLLSYLPASAILYLFPEAGRHNDLTHNRILCQSLYVVCTSDGTRYGVTDYSQPRAAAVSPP